MHWSALLNSLPYIKMTFPTRCPVYGTPYPAAATSKLSTAHLPQ